MRLVIVASHPIQYYAPIYRELARRVDLQVFFSHRASSDDQAKAGFGVGFEWDSDLYSNYSHEFLRNASRRPSLDRFAGCDTPDVGGRLREGQFDALLVQGWHLKAFLQAIVAAKRLGLAVIARGDSHLGTPRSVFKKAAKATAYPVLLRAFDAALYVGQQSRAYWERYRYPKDRLFFSPHCVDTEWFATRATAQTRRTMRERLGIAPDEKVVLFAGKLLPFKRPLDLIAAAAISRKKGMLLHVLVAGAGPLENEMIEAALGADVPLHMLGFCNQSEMPRAYAAADVLVLPSDGRETWGLVANEAIACGRPIIVSDAVGCAPDLTQNGAVGRIFPAGDAAALANAMIDTFHNPPADTAIKKINRRYSPAAASEGVLNAISTAVSKRRPASKCSESRRPNR